MQSRRRIENLATVRFLASAGVDRYNLSVALNNKALHMFLTASTTTEPVQPQRCIAILATLRFLAASADLDRSNLIVALKSTTLHRFLAASPGPDLCNLAVAQQKIGHPSQLLLNLNKGNLSVAPDDSITQLCTMCTC
jgi:hypothetical protein